MRQATTLALHPRAPQRPRGERDAAGAGGREQARGGHAGHGDLVARAPVDPRLAAHEDRAEEDHVAGEGQALQEERRDQPPGLAVAEVVDRLRGPAGDLRQDEVQEGDRPTATKTPKTRARSRVMTTRGISSSSASSGCWALGASTGAELMRAPAPRAAGASGSPRAAPARHDDRGGARPRPGPARRRGR